MYSKRLNYVFVGLFVVAILAGMIVSLIKLSGWAVDRDRYFTAFPRVAGLQNGTKVLYEGYPIGRVTGIGRLDEEEARRLLGAADRPLATHFRVDFEVAKGWPIPGNAEAEVVAAGLLAAVSINISERAVVADERLAGIAADGFVPGRASEDLVRRAVRLADAIESLVTQADTMLSGKVDPILSDVQVLASKLATDLPALVDRAADFVDTINAAAGDVRLLLRAENREQVESAIGKLDTAAADLNTLLARLNRLAGTLNEVADGNRRNVDQALDSLRYTLNSVARDIDAITRNIEGTSRNMNEFSRQIRQNPGVLLGGTTPRDNAQRRP
jgi:phospholipid/cholesterol/gamma-HCH transport system substrate-binding protein